MKIVYREGETLFVAQCLEIGIQGNNLFATLATGKVLQRSFPSPEILSDFFQQVVLTAGDNPIHLENTNIDPRLSQIMDDWDSMYE